MKQVKTMKEKIHVVFFLVFLVTSFFLSTKTADSSANIVENSWVSKAPMQQARSDLGVAVINEKIFAIGGVNHEGFSSTNEEYDLRTNSWTFKASMPTARSAFGITVYKNKIYCIGGYADGLATGVNEVYDPETDTWETKAPMPTSRMNIQANIVNNLIYLIGGSPTETVNEVYDPETDTWETKSSIPIAVPSYTSEVVDNKIYVITSSLNLIYHVENDSWSHGVPSPYPSIIASSGATTDMFAPERIYVFGADADLPYWQLTLRNFTTQSYNPKTNKWTVCASMPTGRFDAAVAVVNDRLFVIGGFITEYRNDTFTITPLTVFSTVNEQYTPIDFGSAAPYVQVVSPENSSNPSNNANLVFTLNKPVVWMGYCIDEQNIVTITGNSTLPWLPSGLHSITVYAKDEFENLGSSKRVIFTISEEQEPTLEPEQFFPTTPIVVSSVALVTIIGTGILFYFKKMKPRHNNK